MKCLQKVSMSCLQLCRWIVSKNRVDELSCRWIVLFPNILRLFTGCILALGFGGWGNKMSAEKNLHHYWIWRTPSFDFCMIHLSPCIHGIFIPCGLKTKWQSPGQPFDYVYRSRAESVNDINLIFLSQTTWSRSRAAVINHQSELQRK